MKTDKYISGLDDSISAKNGIDDELVGHHILDNKSTNILQIDENNDNFSKILESRIEKSHDRSNLVTVDVLLSSLRAVRSQVSELNNVYSVFVTKQAQEDLIALEKFYYESAGLESAIRFEEAVETALDIISESPYLNRRFSDKFDESIRRIFLHKRKTMIIYRIDEDRLEVIAVAAGHSSASPENLFDEIQNRLDAKASE